MQDFILFFLYLLLLSCVGGGGVEQKVFVGPTEIVSFVFLVVFKDGGFRVNPGFHLFLSDVNQGNEDAG